MRRKRGFEVEDSGFGLAGENRLVCVRMEGYSAIVIW